MFNLPDPILQHRRSFFARSGHLLGSAALAQLASAPGVSEAAGAHQAPGPHFTPKAKRVIYLHMVGGPSQMDLPFSESNDRHNVAGIAFGPP